MPRFIGARLPQITATLLTLAFATSATAWQKEFADSVVEAIRTKTPKPQLSIVLPEASLKDAYDIQGMVVGQLYGSDGIGGFKAAVVGEKGQTGLGIDGPLAAVVPKEGILSAANDVVVDLAEEPVRFLETEIGYRVGQRIGAPIADVATLKGHIRAIVAIIEVPGGAAQDEKPATAADLVARNIDSMSVIAGKHDAPTTIDVDAIAITLTRDGEIINTARSGDAHGGQWETLRKTMNILVAEGYTVEKGHVVTNGALGSIKRAAPGHYKADFGVLGVIEFSVRGAVEKEKP